jgi:hypothetical protein
LACPRGAVYRSEGGQRIQRLGRDFLGQAVYSRRLYEAREVGVPWRGCV